MKLNIAEFVLLAPLLCNIASSTLELSHQTEVKQENDTLGVMCRDKDTGAGTIWTGPKNKRLGEKTNPISKMSNYGNRLIFPKIRKEDAGTYKCKTTLESAEFRLIVEDKTETSIDNPEPIFIETSIYDNKKHTYAMVAPKRHQIVSSTITTTPEHLEFVDTPTEQEEHLEFVDTPTEQEGPFKFVDTPSEQEGLEGTDITLRCEARGGNTSWSINGADPKEPKYEVIGDGLLVRNASKNDPKIYSCHAVSDGTGNMMTREINLKLTHKPRLPLNTTTKHYMREVNVYGYFGGEVNLSCEVEAEPPPTFTWFEKSKKQKIGEEITVNPYHSVLRLIMTEKNMGEYKCEAKNKNGRLDVMFNLFNITQSMPPTYIKLREPTSDTLTLEIDGPEPTDEEIKANIEPMGYYVEYRPHDLNEFNWTAETFPKSEAKTYNLTRLAQNTTYEVRAATESPAGFSDFTNIKYFTTAAANSLHLNISLVASFIFSFSIVLFNGLIDRHIC